MQCKLMHKPHSD